MTSLRVRLFLLLLAATVLVWSAAAAWTYASTRADVQRVLDRRMVEAAGMVASLAQGSVGPGTRAQAAVKTAVSPAYSRQLSCQIWTLDGRLVGRSSSAPRQPLGIGRPGFSERVIDGEHWRVYTLVDQRSGLRVLVGDNLEVRSNLIADVMRGLLLPALAGVFGLALLLWAVVGAGLRPLRRVAEGLRRRDPSDHSSLPTTAMSSELRPLIDAINSLFQRVDQLRASERHFIASAAHELQTPLAGLRAHAQVALAAEGDVRERSLRSIQESVDRTSRMVGQLLDLSREEAEAEPLRPSWVSVSSTVRAVADELTNLLDRREVSVVIEPQAQRAELYVDEAGLLLTMRNLVKNAVQHAPAGSSVKVGVGSAPNGDWLSVIDSGPGVPSSELLRVRARFVRGIGAKGDGSGLGLSIVDLVLERIGGRLELVNEAEGGLRATMHFRVGSLRSSGGEL